MKNIKGKRRVEEMNGGKIFLQFYILFVLLILLSGCWDRTEVNDLAIVTGTAIDKKDDDSIELTLQVFIPKALSSGGGQGGGGSGGGKMTLTASQTGKNMADALSKMQSKLPREVFWGQCKVFIFGEDFAKEGIQQELDFLLRHPEPRGRALVFVSKGKAKTILELTANLERYTAEVLREIAEFGTGLHVTIQDLNEKLTGVPQGAGIPYAKISTQKSSSGEPIKYVHIDGAAVMKKDRMVGTITEKETRGVLWLRDEVKRYTINVKLKNVEGRVALNPVSARVNLIPQIQDGKWGILVKINTEGAIVQNETKLDLTNPKLLKKVEEAYEKSIKNRITLALEKTQHELKIDIADFSKAFQRKYPNEWKKAENHWSELFPEVEVSFDIKARIRREGNIGKPGALPRKEVKKD